MQQIVSYGLATGRYAMGSSEPLGAPCPEYFDTQESESVIVDDDYQ
jgi:hypothetical protein